jgi:hypothetical protein
MIWARMLAYITGTVDQELLLRNEYLAAENRILRPQIQGRLLLSDAEKATLAEFAYAGVRRRETLLLLLYTITSYEKLGCQAKRNDLDLVRAPYYYGSIHDSFDKPRKFRPGPMRKRRSLRPRHPST